MQKKTMFIIAAVVIVLGVAGYFGWQYYEKKKAA